MRVRNPFAKVGRACRSVTPVGFEGIATAGTLSARKRLRRLFCTVNSAEMRLSVAICTANIAGVADGEWALIAPYGEFPSPDGSYVQRFDRPQADKVVSTWNSIPGIGVRLLKNVSHRLGVRYSAPVWDGHPDTDKLRWPKERLLAEVTDLRAGDAGLEGRVTWNAQGAAARTRGPLYPSPWWWHMPPAGTPPTVFPELLMSIGLVPTPNISSVPAWTSNATLAGFSADNQENQNDMQHRDQLIALLGLKADATDSAIQSSLDAHSLKVTSTANALSLAETNLATANAAVLTITTERDGLKTANAGLITERDTLTTANAALTTEVKTLRLSVLDIAEAKGAISPAERASYETRLSTANTAADALKELPKRKALNVQSIELNGNRIDLSTANARQSVINAAVDKRMKDEGIDHATAYQRVKADPKFKPVFDAMADPTRKEA